MTTVNDLINELGQLATTKGSAIADMYSLLADVDPDLDLASAMYYLKKEFRRNDTGMDRRVEIYTLDLDYEEDDDEDEDFDDWYCCEDCG